MPETTHRFKSAHTANERTIWFHGPADPAKPCNLAIFLDGEFYRDRVEAIATLDHLSETTAISNTLSVFVSHESLDARWRECPCYPPFADFVNLELLPWIESLRPQTKHRTTCALLGLSYTGLAGAFVALRAPDNFTHVIAQSGSFWSDDCALAKNYRAAAILPHTAFYLEVGTRETNTNVQHKPDLLQTRSQIEGVKVFRDALQSRGLGVTYTEFDGAHEFGAWKKSLPAALKWALPTASPKTTDAPR